MNKQLKLNPDGSVKSLGIEWTHRRMPDGSLLSGYTSNAVGGCQHGCRWKIGGKIAICYAEDTANGIASAHYPQGFEHHYWNPEEIEKWKALPAGTRVFWDSMSDSMGHWVPDEQIQAMIDGAKQCPQINFQSLTKNPKRYLQFDFPPNVWLGASSPPDVMEGHDLSAGMREALMLVTLRTFQNIGSKNVRFLSIEPLTFNAVPLLKSHPDAVDWVIVGAASIGREKVPPNEGLVRDIVYWCSKNGVPIFFKGNMASLEWAQKNWHEAFPDDRVSIS